MDVPLPLARNLQIIQWNARSLRKHISDFTISLYTTKPDIVAIQETKLKPNKKTPRFISYDVLRKDRLNDGGGGIMF